MAIEIEQKKIPDPSKISFEHEQNPVLDIAVGLAVVLENLGKKHNLAQNGNKGRERFIRRTRKPKIENPEENTQAS